LAKPIISSPQYLRLRNMTFSSRPLNIFNFPLFSPPLLRDNAFKETQEWIDGLLDEFCQVVNTFIDELSL
jgi:hypothetical protein